MGLCAYNGGLNRFHQLVKVNIWDIEISKLLRLAGKTERNQPLNQRDLNTLRHEGTNYDSLLNSITVSPEKREFFQAVANEMAEQALKEVVFSKERQNPLSEYLKVATELEQQKQQMAERGKKIAELDTKIGHQRKALGQQNHTVMRLKQELEAHEQLVGKLQQQLQEQQQQLQHYQLENQFNQKQQEVAVAAMARLESLKRRLWMGVCASAMCGLVLGVAVTSVVYSSSNTQVTSELPRP